MGSYRTSVMTTQSFLLGPINEALSKNSKPAFSPEDSFEVLTNSYQWRGRIVKRSGYTTLGRLANGTPVMGLKTKEGFAIGVQTLVAFDTTQAYEWNGTIFNPLASVMPVLWSGTDYQFFWTINYANAFWATNFKPGLHGFVINGISNAAVAVVSTTLPNGFSSGQSVTIINVTGYTPGVTNPPPINGQVFTITVLTPTTFSIPLDGTLYNAYGSGGLALNSQVSIPGQDGIRYYGVLSSGTGWANYNPPIDPDNALAGALLIFAYRGYLVFLNTIEGNDLNPLNLQRYPNRARWTQIGTPYYSPPTPQNPNIMGFDPKAVRDDLFGRGGANDAPTNEAIVGAGFIRDILIVYFERSTWRLRFVNNAQNPFVWERVNIELGSSCTFSAIQFDKGLMSISNRGIVISDGNDTIRFDDKIPDDIFDIKQSNQGLQRVYGIRTYRSKLNFWTFPTAETPSGIYPDQVLVFNYETKNWSYFDDSFTCFGYYYETGIAYTWNDLKDKWSSYKTIAWNNGTSQQGYENIVAGNQQGYVLRLEQTDGENGPSLAISVIANGTPSVFTSNNHNLKDGSWIELKGVTGTTSTDGVSLNGRRFKVANPNQDANTFMLTEFEPIAAGNAVGASFNYFILYTNIFPGSLQINIGTLVYFDTNLDGILYEAATPLTPAGTIDYDTGEINITFNPIIVSTPVNIRVVTLDPSQESSYDVETMGVYGMAGEIIIVSGLDIQTKIYQFFQDDQRCKISKIDFYVDRTTNGQFTCDIFADSSNVPVNTPLSDNPKSNIVETSINPYQVGEGNETITRLWCDAFAQTVQVHLYYSNYQMAIRSATDSDIQIVAMMISLRRGGRLV